MKHFMKKHESGRSMVEILGVLAIIGVLTLGGIAGYRLAMDKHRANEVVNTLSQMVISATAQYASTGKRPDLMEFDGQDLAGFDWEALEMYNDNYPDVVTIAIYDFPVKLLRDIDQLAQNISGIRTIRAVTTLGNNLGLGNAATAAIKRCHRNFPDDFGSATEGKAIALIGLAAGANAAMNCAECDAICRAQGKQRANLVRTPKCTCK